jgi:hypothetical protein
VPPATPCPTEAAINPLTLLEGRIVALETPVAMLSDSLDALRERVAEVRVQSAVPRRPAPDYHGLATFYSEEYAGHPMRNGQPYDPKAFTCAVPTELWQQLRGKTLWVCAVGTDRCVSVLVTDSGYLTEAGAFCSSDTGWKLHEVGERIVVDLSPAAIEVLSPRRDTTLVDVWVR